MTLLSDAELAAVQDAARSGMTTPVYIYHGTVTRTDNGQSFDYPATPDVTTVGWLAELTPNAVRLGISDGLTQLAETHRLFLPIGTECRTGDKLVIKGTEFIAQHTNFESTYPTSLTVALRTLV